MTRVAAATRRPGLLAAMLVSVSLAGIGLWAWLGPDTVDSVSTTGLLALLGLLVFPCATFATMLMEWRARGPADRGAHPAARRAGDTLPIRGSQHAAPPLSPGATPVLPCDIGPPGGMRPEKAKPAGAHAGSATA